MIAKIIKYGEQQFFRNPLADPALAFLGDCLIRIKANPFPDERTELEHAFWGIVAGKPWSEAADDYEADLRAHHPFTPRSLYRGNRRVTR